MAKSNIEWTDFTWNPWLRDKKRYGQDPTQVVRASDKTFYAPLKLKEPRRIFTCSWSDFFIEEADEWRDEAFAIMALTPHIQYQILTKRPERMLDWFKNRGEWPLISMIFDNLPDDIGKKAFLRSSYASIGDIPWPLPNVWLGVSAEDRDTYIHRLPYLAMTPGATKFVSLEPLLGDLGDLMLDGIFEGVYQWAIVGGESGPNRRVAKLEWIESIVEQCKAASVPVFVKQISINNKVSHDMSEWPERLTRT